MEDDERWSVVDESFTEDNHTTSGDGDLASRVSLLKEALTVRSIEGEDDILYVSYETDDGSGGSSTDATQLELRVRLRPFILELTSSSSSSDGDDPVTTFRPVVNIAISDVRAHPQELNDQMTHQLGDLLLGPRSGRDPSIVSFLKSLESPTRPFSIQDAHTWRDLIKAATSEGRITALRPGEVTVDPTRWTEYNRVPEDVSPCSSLVPAPRRAPWRAPAHRRIQYEYAVLYSMYCTDRVLCVLTVADFFSARGGLLRSGPA